MSHSIEVRVPFLDHAVAEWCLAIPPRLKRARREKRVLRRAMAGDLPPEIRDRKKRGLAGPQGDWLGPSPPRFVAELLSPEGLRAKGWFDPPRVARRMSSRGHAGTGSTERAFCSALIDLSITAVVENSQTTSTRPGM